MGNEDDSFYKNDTPMFNAGIGAVILLDDLFKLASGYLLNEDVAKYQVTLEGIYIELIYWIEKKGKVKWVKEIEELENIRSAASTLDIGKLKQYHILLNKYANKCSLRLKSSDGLPGVMGGN